jgi:uncharacterized membrane protein YoaK (UPF0700 family)
MRLTGLAIAAAPMLFVLLWSTGFIGARFGLPYIEPMTFLAIRMVFVVFIMTAIALAAQARWPHGPEIGHSLVAGALVRAERDAEERAKARHPAERRTCQHDTAIVQH